MSFILKMAWRDTRASRRRLLLYSLSIVLGVAALIGISSLGDTLRAAVDSQAKGLLGADLSAVARQNFSDKALARFRATGGEMAQGVATTTMATFGDGTRRLVQIAAIEGGFPFYGDVETAPAGAFALIADGHGAVVEETALTQAGAAIGGEIKLGGSTFTIVGALKKYPGQSPFTSMFAPRVQVSMAALQATNLLNRGSMSQRSVYLKLPDGTDAKELEKKLRADLRGERVNFATAEERKEQIGDALKNIFSFTSLVGFLALFLGAVGVASAMHVFIRQRLATVAVLRCLGASARTSFAIYLVQGIGLGVVGSLLGVLLGLSLQFTLPILLQKFLPYHLEFVISWIAVLKGVIAGVGVSALFTLLPLLEVRRVSPLHVLRSGYEDDNKPDPLRWLVYVGIGASVFGFATLQTGLWKVGLAFSVAMGVSFAVLAGAAMGIIWLARHLRTGWLPYTWRQGVANVHRPNNRTLLLMMSLGLGTFMLLTLLLTRAALLGQLDTMGSGDRPNLMFYDVQSDQIDKLIAIAKRENVPLTKTSPIITMRLGTLKGRSAEEIAADKTSSLPNWALRREYRSTYRAAVDDAEKVIAGTFVGKVAADDTARVPVSIEEGLAKDLQLKLGDELDFNVQGVTVKAVIGSVRQVEWRRMQTNFFFVFPDGPLNSAPATFAAAAKAQNPQDTARLQRAVAKELPNVSAIDLGFVLRLLDGIFTKIAWAISFLASFTVITGLVVLVSAVLMGRHQRVREAVLLRTLGAQRAQLRQIMFAEYAVLGLLAALTGGVLAVAANSLLAKFVFKVSAVPPLPLLAGAVGAVTLLTVVTGWLANRGVSGHPPLEILRQET